MNEAPALSGTQWKLVELQGEAPVEGTTITAHFDDGRVTGSGGCNRYFGGFTTQGSNIELSQLGSTRMACAEAAMVQEDAYLRALTTAQSFNVHGGHLVLEADDEVLAIFVPDEERDEADK